MTAGQGLVQFFAELLALPAGHADDQQWKTLTDRFRQSGVGAQGEGQILARLQGTDTEEVFPRFDAVGLEYGVDSLGGPRVKTRGYTQRCDDKSLGR
ncbi:hypothetical protein D3C71_1351870 [compost metagenome]